jgi:chemotaxis protein MotB
MKRKKAAAHANHERWLVSYADFITLLFAFFVVMFASSQADKSKAKAVSDSVREALDEGQFSNAISVVLGRGKHEAAVAARIKPLPDARDNPLPPPLPKMDAKGNPIAPPPAATDAKGNPASPPPAKMDAKGNPISPPPATDAKGNPISPPPATDAKGNPISPPPPKTEYRPAELHPADLVKSLDTLQHGLAAELKSGKVQVNLEGRGLVISLREAAFFASGDDTVTPASFAMLVKIAAVIQALPNPLRLEGYTDSVPIHNSRFRNNWGLSAARSVAMLEVLRDRYKISPERMCVAGYAENAPADTNETEQGRAHNRRVDVVLLSAEGLKVEPQAAPQKPSPAAPPAAPAATRPVAPPAAHPTGHK